MQIKEYTLFTPIFINKMKGKVVNALFQLSPGAAAISITGYMSVIDETQSQDATHFEEFVVSVCPVEQEKVQQLQEKESTRAYTLSDIGADFYAPLHTLVAVAILEDAEAE